DAHPPDRAARRAQHRRRRWRAVGTRGRDLSAAAENPLLEGLRMRRTPEPCVLTIFGASGDLTQRKLFPALYSLAFRRLLPEKFGVLGVARTEETTEEFVGRMRDAVKQFARDPFRDDIWETLAAGIRYVGSEFADDAGMDHVGNVLTELDEKRGTGTN